MNSRSNLKPEINRTETARPETLEASYNSELEGMYLNLLKSERAGKISQATHIQLEQFIGELRELVAEHTQREAVKKAA